MPRKIGVSDGGEVAGKICFNEARGIDAAEDVLRSHGASVDYGG
jgi:hypothetical protein